MGRIIFILIVFLLACTIVALIVKVVMTPNRREIEDQLYELKNMKENGLISEEEYEKKRSKLSKKL